MSGVPRLVPDPPVISEEHVDATDALLGELFSLLPPTLLGREGTPKVLESHSQKVWEMSVVDSQGKADILAPCWWKQEVTLPLFLGSSLVWHFLVKGAWEAEGKEREGRRRVRRHTYTHSETEVLEWNPLRLQKAEPNEGKCTLRVQDCYQKIDFSIPNAKQKVGVFWVGLEGRLGTKGRDRASLTPQNENWISVECFIDVCLPPHHITVWVKDYPRPTKENRTAWIKILLSWTTIVITWNFSMGQHGLIYLYMCPVDIY